MKNVLSSIVGAVGGCVAYLLGGWDLAIQTLVLFQAIDYSMGFIVAAVFKNSDKSETGALQSKAGWKGLCKKGVTLLIVLVAAQLDRMAGTNSLIRDAVIIAYIANESISIIENAGLMGLDIPAPIVNAIDVLKKKSQDGVKKDD